MCVPGDEGAFAIANVLARSTSMQDFRMSSTRVMEKGGLALAQAIGAGAHPHIHASTSIPRQSVS
jgi:Ran GTPase-activating protein 1